MTITLKAYYKISWREAPSILKNVLFCHDYNPYRNTNVPGGVLNFELGTDVRPEVSNTTL